MNRKTVRTISAIVVAAVFAGTVAGILLARNDSGREAARSSLNRLAGGEDPAAFAERNSAALPMPRDNANALLHIGQRIVGPAGDPEYYMPVSGPLPEFLTNPEAQEKTRDLLAENREAIRDLQTFYERKGGAQTILAPEELRKFRRSIGKIINLCCDRMAPAILTRNRAQAERILEESCHFLTVASLPSSLRELSDFNIALTVWQVHIFGNYVNSFPPTEREIEALTAQLQTLQGRLRDSFRSTLAGECLALYRQISTGDPRIFWRIDRYDDYFRQLKQLPRDRWIQADRIFQIAEKISCRYSDFREYHAFADSLRALEKETAEAPPLTRNFCRLFWPLCRSEAVIYAQFQCDLVKLAALKFWNREKHLPRNPAELAAVNLPEQALIDPLTGRPFSFEIGPGESRIQVLHGGKNWGSPIRLSRR